MAKLKIVPANTPLAHPGTRAYYVYRLLESIPAILSYGTLLTCVLLSFVAPLAAVYLILLYDLYWLVRVGYLSVYTITSWRRYRKAININWRRRLEVEVPHWQRYEHVIFFPMYNEPYAVVKETFDRLVRSDYDLAKVTIILTGEARTGEHFTTLAEQVKSVYGNAFGHFIINVHPADVPGEQPGKGSNMRHAGRVAKEYVDSQGWNYDDVIVSAFDIDTWVHPQYLAALTHRYGTVANPTRCSYQPLALYHNNIWKSDPFTRVVAYSTTFWLLTDLARAERLFTFSSHSMSWRALVDVGFWAPDVVSEDSRIFLQCLLRYDGDYHVEPIYVPVSMATAYMGKFWRSIRNQYLQVRRWAWGVENFPYMAWHFARGEGRRIPRAIKIKHLFNYIEGNFSWATSALVITILGFLPFHLASEGVQQLAIIQNTPRVLETILSLALIGLVVNAILGTWMLPDEAPKRKVWVLVAMLAQYALVFVTMIVFGAMPALDSQLRHLLGGRFRLGFLVTEKRA
jgi:cellulose synthase/poly-beta-1,6-N-acetylglucosamine synthase-like glycosyltransferase